MWCGVGGGEESNIYERKNKTTKGNKLITKRRNHKIVVSYKYRSVQNRVVVQTLCGLLIFIIYPGKIRSGASPMNISSFK